MWVPSTTRSQEGVPKQRSKRSWSRVWLHRAGGASWKVVRWRVRSTRVLVLEVRGEVRRAEPLGTDIMVFIAQVRKYPLCVAMRSLP